MESIYHPSQFNASKPVPIKEYFERYSQYLSNTKCIGVAKNVSRINDKAFAALGQEMSDDDKADLQASCSTDLLTVPGETQLIETESFRTCGRNSRAYVSFELTEAAKKLKTIEEFIKKDKKDDKSSIYRAPDVYVDSLVAPISTEPNDLCPGRDIIIFVRLFRPFEYKYGNIVYDPLRFDQEIKLLGSNTLADFRDSIGCRTKLTTHAETSEIMDEIDEFSSTDDLYPSGFIFIDDVFYNDFRKSGSIDYSEVIRKWAKEKRIGIFTCAEMKDVRLDSLKPKLGYPYVYQHQGRCEHVFVFSHIRLLKNDDPLCSAVYPYHSNVGGQRNTLCLMCGTNFALWLILEYDKIPRDKAPMCNDCFSSFCYVDGKRIDNFQAYPFLTKTPLI